MKARMLNFGLVACLITPCFTSVPCASLTFLSQSVSADAAKEIEDGHELLRNGTWFSLAIEHFKQAIELSPQNCRAYLLLGCAYADRAAAFKEAASRRTEFEQKISAFPQVLAQWETAQQNPGSRLYQTSRPIVPILATRDDERPFKLSEKEISAKIADYSKKAQEAWSKAISFASTVKERGETLYTIGWGKELLRYAGYGIFPEAELPPLSASLDLLKKATETDAKNSVYWQSLGDLSSGDLWRRPLQSSYPASLLAYRQSLKLNPKSKAVALEIFLLSSSLQEWDEAQTAAQQAGALDGSNSFWDYQQAIVLYGKATHNHQARDYNDFQLFAATEIGKALGRESDRPLIEQAIQAVANGTKKPFYQPPTYRLEVPADLKNAFGYIVRYDIEVWNFVQRVCPATSQTLEAAKFYAKRGEQEKAEQLVLSVVAVGENYLHQINEDQTTIYSTTGVLATAFAYQLAKDGYAELTELAGSDAARKESIKKRRDELYEVAQSLIALHQKHTEAQTN